MPELAPSPAFFKPYLKEWKKQPPKSWCSTYEEGFNDELKSEGKLDVTNMRKAGVDRSVIMKITSHKKTGMFDRYNTVDSEDARSAMER